MGEEKHVTTGAGPAPWVSAEHVVGIWSYVAVYVALLGLTALTTFMAFIDLGPLNNVVAVGIAALKAVLVALVFMHLYWAPKLLPLAALAGVLWVGSLIAGLLADYLARGMLGVPGK